MSGDAGCRRSPADCNIASHYDACRGNNSTLMCRRGSQVALGGRYILVGTTGMLQTQAAYCCIMMVCEAGRCSYQNR